MPHPPSSAAEPDSTQGRWHCLPPITSGGLEAIKWIALLLMTGDHINSFLLGHRYPALFAAGRMCWPLFAFSLTYNLAQRTDPAAIRASCSRVMSRAALAGLAATPAFIGLGAAFINGWLPLNVMFTFCLVAGIIFLVSQSGSPRIPYAWQAVALALPLGLLVEFWWHGCALAFGLWLGMRPTSKGLHEKVPAICLIVLSTTLLCLDSMSIWPLAGAPLVLLISKLNVQVPRVRGLRWFFYIYYPAHLYALWLVKSVTLTTA